MQARAPTERTGRARSRSRTSEPRGGGIFAKVWIPPTGRPSVLREDDQLTADLIAPHYSVGSNGKLLIESKDEIRACLGRSTDFGDAVVVACFDAARGVGRGWMEYFQQQTVRDAEKPPERPA